ncbi:MAG TPA: hypothetical protein VFL10_11545 [Ornithinibacter sp.]|nr:hypothetical protein [Ornithinibacter sp.]
MTTMPRRVRRIAPVTALAAALVAGAAVPASAAPPFTEHWDDDVTVVHPAGSADFCDLPFDVVERTQERGSFVGVNRGPAGLFYGAAKFNGTITWTNPANGRNYRNEYSGSDRDQKVVDNGDGTLTLQVQQTGPNRYYDNGTLAFIDTGMVRFTITFDDGGTPTDPTDDGEGQFVSLDALTGLRQTQGRDFCADLVEFLG